MAIEILENTLLKLLVRRGTDVDRKQITLESGELGYATDTQRLWIGTGNTAGGVIVGNKFLGKHNDVTTFAPAVTGDCAFDTDNNILYVCTAGDGSIAEHWTTIATNTTAADTSILINDGQGISIGSLSATNVNGAAVISTDLLGSSIERDTNSKIALSGTVNIDYITQRTVSSSSYLSLPTKLKINAIDYDFPGVAPTEGSSLIAKSNGTLSWGPPEIVTATVAPTTAVATPVGTIFPFASGDAEVPHGWLPCDGRSVVGAHYKDLSAVIANNYGGDTVNFNLPNLDNKVLYGATTYPVDTTLMGVTTGAAGATHGSLLSATGMTFIIKAVGGVTSPTLTIRKNLSAFINTVDKTDIAFDPLSGNIVIERPPPGMVVYDVSSERNGSDYTFIVPAGIHYLKFYVTGSGATGGDTTGGSSATVIGYLSAYPGTELTIGVGKTPGYLKDQAGNPSYIKDNNGTTLAQADGGKVSTSTTRTLTAGGEIETASVYVLNGYVINGGYGGVDTDHADGEEEGSGTGSYWGGPGAPGAGGSSHGGSNNPGPGVIDGTPNRFVSDGIVQIEWS
tara:strand:- start:5774 stop:7471 length:1698 start_codon:yes stop_codon:yes gene_type:complete